MPSFSLSLFLARPLLNPHPTPPQVVIGILRNRYEVAKVKHVTFSSATSCDKVPIILAFIFQTSFADIIFQIPFSVIGLGYFLAPPSSPSCSASSTFISEYVLIEWFV